MAGREAFRQSEDQARPVHDPESFRTVRADLHGSVTRRAHALLEHVDGLVTAGAREAIWRYGLAPT